jgi:hypothetical protein
VAPGIYDISIEFFHFYTRCQYIWVLCICTYENIYQIIHRYSSFFAAYLELLFERCRYACEELWGHIVKKVYTDLYRVYIILIYLQIFLLHAFSSTHIPTQDSRYRHGIVFVLVVFYYSHQCPPTCECCSVIGMYEFHTAICSTYTGL